MGDGRDRRDRREKWMKRWTCREEERERVSTVVDGLVMIIDQTWCVFSIQSKVWEEHATVQIITLCDIKGK